MKKLPFILSLVILLALSGALYYKLVEAQQELSLADGALESSPAKIDGIACFHDKILYPSLTDTVIGEDLYKKLLIKSDTDESIISNFMAVVANNDILDSDGNNAIYHLCEGDAPEIFAFVAYGNYPNLTNNALGYFDGTDLTVQYVNNPDSGDIGVCEIQGVLDNGAIVKCGGGDGPLSWQKIYVVENGRTDPTLVKDCSTQSGVETCVLNNAGF